MLYLQLVHKPEYQLEFQSLVKNELQLRKHCFLQSQVAVLSKFLHAAQLCKEMRNYATCLAIADGLENIIIKQLPAWKNLPTKSYAVMEDLKSVRV